LKLEVFSGIGALFLQQYSFEKFFTPTGKRDAPGHVIKAWGVVEI
jgi:hypothetical protein